MWRQSTGQVAFCVLVSSASGKETDETDNHFDLQGHYSTEERTETGNAGGMERNHASQQGIANV